MNNSDGYEYVCGAIAVISLGVVLVLLLPKLMKRDEGYERSELGNNCAKNLSLVDYAPRGKLSDHPHYKANPHTYYQPLEYGPVDTYSYDRYRVRELEPVVTFHGAPEMEDVAETHLMDYATGVFM